MTDARPSYECEHTELKCIGRGNFGSAFLVKRKSDGEKYVAKKIALGKLPEKEQQSALMEVELLKHLDHPNIVDYYGSYIEEGVLIIIMEYCDVGDLSYHINKKKKAGENFTEDEILNWFVQISMALEYIHGRKVLHRDIKASNIFLTGNNTVKLGDFGISRVLENTSDAAQTCVGTPYYLSPEVCKNNPYTYKSDVWALGCVLYELCCLEHAFSADNLLGLAYKIVQETHSPIPDRYSEDLQKIVEMLLVKDSNERPLVSQLLMTPFITEKMKEFILNGGFIGDQNLPVRKMKSRKIGQTSTQDTSSPSLKTEDEEAKTIGRHMTKEERKMRENTSMAISNYSTAKQRNMQQIYGSTFNYAADNSDDKQSILKVSKHHSVGGARVKNNLTGYPSKMQGGLREGVEPNNMMNEKQEFESTTLSDSFAANDRTMTHANKDQCEDTFAANDRCEDTFAANDRAEDTFAANDRCEDTFAANDREITQFSSSKVMETFKLSESNGTLISGLSQEDSIAQTMSKMQHKSVSYDDRKIVSSGKYDPEEYYYNYECYESDEFEEDEDDVTTGSTTEEAKKDANELTSIVDNYKNFLNNDATFDETEIDIEFQKEQERLNEQLKYREDIPIHETAQIQASNKKLEIMKIVGPIFDKVYTILKEERLKETSDSKIYKKLRKYIPKENKKAMSKMFELDQIVVQEILKGE
ncbi:unnamed protein product [Moneuplotes crassus]|uniref:non-specific serine/threonine protein kinase n=1 Tax=Euplotes crassus TaxID=5936 RepID=A0AAD1U3W7_EUPCR|nr:unnamed protein product [Moneuplotes crassus]